MYYFRYEKRDELLKGKTVEWLSRELDYTMPMLYNIFNNNIGCRKIIAFAIVKMVDLNYSIDDFFEYKDEERN